MPWFAAHALMYFKPKSGTQNNLTAWENIYLIEARDVDQAWERAMDRAREEEGDDEGSLTFDGAPATLVFAGIRALSEISHQGDDGQLRDGDEITFLEFQVADEKSIGDLLQGEEVSITFSKVETTSDDF